MSYFYKTTYFDQSMHKNALFLLKNCKNLSAAGGFASRPLMASGVPRQPNLPPFEKS